MTLLERYEQDTFELQAKYASIINSNAERFARGLMAPSIKNISYEPGDAVFWFDITLESGYVVQYDLRGFSENIRDGNIKLVGEDDEELSIKLDTSAITQKELAETLELLDRLLEDHGTSIYNILEMAHRNAKGLEKTPEGE